MALPDNQHALKPFMIIKLFNVNDGAVMRTFAPTHWFATRLTRRRASSAARATTPDRPARPRAVTDLRDCLLNIQNDRTAAST